MKKISLNFFGEEVSINMPTDLSSLRQQISEKFMFNPSDAAEIVVSYAKDLGKKIIETEQDFVNFISDKINKIDLDISPDSKLYLNNLNILQKESDDNKKQLEEAIKKRDEIKKRKETILNQKKIEIENLENQIKEIKNKKKLLEKTTEKEKKQFYKEEKEINKKIAKLQEKLGITKPKNDKLKSCRKEDRIPMMIEKFLRHKSEDYKKIETIPEAIVTKINKITFKIIEQKLKKMHSFEKELKDKKIELKPEEREFFMNYPKLCNEIGRRVNSFSISIQCETKKLIQDIAKIKKNQKQILCPLRKKLEQINLIKKIGEGGQAKVYMGTYENQKVAVKLMKNVDYKCFAHELVILAFLEHENIPKFYGIVREKNVLSLVFEFIEGKTLDKFKISDFSTEQKYNIIYQLTSCLEYIHNKKFIHRDLKHSGAK